LLVDIPWLHKLEVLRIQKLVVNRFYAQAQQNSKGINRMRQRKRGWEKTNHAGFCANGNPATKAARIPMQINS
jgi:hypothetical protein